MQQAIYHSSTITLPNTDQTALAPAPRRANVLRWIARKWDLVGVVALMGSSAAYGFYALTHLGL